MTSFFKLRNYKKANKKGQTQYKLVRIVQELSF